MNEFFWVIFCGVTSISFHIASVYFAFNNDGRFAMTLLAFGIACGAKCDAASLKIKEEN